MASGSVKVATVLITPRRAAAARLRRARLALGLTQEQVPAFAKARGCEVSERTVRDLELGRVRMTALELAIVLEAAASTLPAAPRTVTRDPNFPEGERLKEYRGHCNGEAGATPACRPGDRVEDVVLDASNETTGGDEPCTLSPNKVAA